MVRIVLTTLGTSGDFNPFLSLGLGLRARGHDVLFAVEPHFLSPLTEAGFAVHLLPANVTDSLFPHMHQFVHARTPLASFDLLVERSILPTLQPTVEALLEACQGADLLVARGVIHLAAPIVAELQHLPWIHVTMTPLTIPSAYTDPGILPFPLPPFLNRLLQQAVVLHMRHLADQRVNVVRAHFGLPPARDVLTTGNLSRLLTAVVVSPSFFAPRPDWPPFVSMTGFCFWDAPPTWREPASLASFLEGDEPVIAVSFGSMAPFVRDAFADLYRTSLAAILRSGARALVIGATPDALPDPLPPHVYALPFAPFSLIYPRCSVVIHHGGPYTAATALRAGVPALIVPWGFDQFFTAAQVQRLGAGRWIDHRSYTMERAVQALSSLLHQQRFHRHAQDFAHKLAQEDGVATLCTKIEHALSTNS